VLVLRYFLDLPEAEAAAALQCSLGTVKSTSAQLTTPSGMQTFPVSPCGLHNCKGGPHGAAASGG
jgi:hypothetical protein